MICMGPNILQYDIFHKNKNKTLPQTCENNNQWNSELMDESSFYDICNYLFVFIKR